MWELRQEVQLVTESPWRLWNLCWVQNFGVSRHDTECRAQQVQSDTKKRAHDLDLKYPDSTFTRVLKSHRKDGIAAVAAASEAEAAAQRIKTNQSHSPAFLPFFLFFLFLYMACAIYFLC
jgi:hypothetical protein